MSYMVLWRASDHITLFESEEYESLPDAKKAIVEFHQKYPWNTYLLVRIGHAERGDESLRPHIYVSMPSEHL